MHKVGIFLLTLFPFFTLMARDDNVEITTAVFLPSRPNVTFILCGKSGAENFLNHVTKAHGYVDYEIAEGEHIRTPHSIATIHHRVADWKAINFESIAASTVVIIIISSILMCSASKQAYYRHVSRKVDIEVPTDPIDGAPEPEVQEGSTNSDTGEPCSDSASRQAYHRGIVRRADLEGLVDSTNEAPQPAVQKGIPNNNAGEPSSGFASRQADCRSVDMSSNMERPLAPTEGTPKPEVAEGLINNDAEEPGSGKKKKRRHALNHRKADKREQQQGAERVLASASTFSPLSAARRVASFLLSPFSKLVATRKLASLSSSSFSQFNAARRIVSLSFSIPLPMRGASSLTALRCENVEELTPASTEENDNQEIGSASRRAYKGGVSRKADLQPPMDPTDESPEVEVREGITENDAGEPVSGTKKKRRHSLHHRMSEKREEQEHAATELTSLSSSTSSPLNTASSLNNLSPAPPDGNNNQETGSASRQAYDRGVDRRREMELPLNVRTEEAPDTKVQEQRTNNDAWEPVSGPKKKKVPTATLR